MCCSAKTGLVFLYLLQAWKGIKQQEAEAEEKNTAERLLEEIHNT